MTQIADPRASFVGGQFKEAVLHRVASALTWAPEEQRARAAESLWDTCVPQHPREHAAGAFAFGAWPSAQALCVRAHHCALLCGVRVWLAPA